MKLNSTYWIACGVLSLTFMTGCGQTVGRSNGPINPEQNPLETETPTPTPVATATPIPTGTPVVPTPTPIPTAFGDAIGKRSFAVVVNKTVAALGEENGNHFAQLRTMNGISSPGGYYGVGYGNKGFLGFGVNYGGVPVSQFESISFRTYEPTTNSNSAYNVVIYLLVDLDCNPLKPNYALVMTPDLRGNPKGTWNRYTIKATDAKFRSPNGRGGLPDSQTRAAPAPLTRLTSAYPKACFVADDIFTIGMKRNQKMAPFQLVHGDSIYTLASAVRIDDVELHMTGSTLVEDFEE